MFTDGPDCNHNGLWDGCDIYNGDESDVNDNSIPDSCETTPGDLNGDGCIDGGDLGLMLALWGTANPPAGDLDGDGVVGGGDLGLLLAAWSQCP
jgi:hypothetical protein